MTTRPPFHEHLRRERELRGWSQADLAEKVGCDTKTIGRWESGAGIPRPYHRQMLSQLFGKNAEELGLMQEKISQPPILEERDAGDHLSPSIHEEDWGEAPYAGNLYGRDQECAGLAHWIEAHRCQVVALLGMGGVGKTAVATKIAAQMRQNFEFVFWRSLQNAPPLELLLKQCISFVSHQQRLDLPGEIDDQISLLLHYMRDHRCLLVLDNFESVMQPGLRAGHLREGYAAYGRLLQRIGEVQHQSCLLLTSREKPKEVAFLEGNSSPVRSLYLSGLQSEAGQQMLRDKGLVGSDAHWQALVERYSGNPLALKVVSESIQEVFEGNIARFLQEEVIAFGDINDLLDQQFQRLTVAEQEIMYWLAIEREAVSLDSLRENLVSPVSTGAQLEALNSLRRRSLVETRGPSEFTLQPVIMEYVTMSLIERAGSEFDSEAPGVWMQFAFCKAQAKDYVRESQVRLLLAPIAQRLLARLGKEGIEQRARNMLERQRELHAQQPGCLAGNIINLLNHLHCNLRGLDFSHLELRQAYLQGVMLPDVNFSYARFTASIFSNTFGNILSVACSPRGDVLAAGTTAGEIWIYDTLAGALHLICHGHSDGVWSLAFSPDGSVLASSSDDHTVRLWDSSSGHCQRILRDHTNRVRAIAFSPDGSTLASGSDDQTIRLWNVESGECLKTLHGHTDRVWSLAFSPGGNLLASGSTDLAVRLWDASTGSCIATLHGHSGWVRSVAFHPGGGILASGSDDQTIRLWNASTGQHLKTLSGHTGRVWSVAFHAASDIVASSSEDRMIRVWDISTGHCIMLLQGHHQGVRSIAFIPDGHMLVSGGQDQTIREWDVSNGHCLRTMQGYTNRVWSIAFHPAGSMLASASEDSVIRLWDVKTGQCLKLLEDKSHGVMTVAFSPRGSTLASGGQDQTIRVWDVNVGRSLRSLRGHTNWVRTIIYSPDGKLLASGSEDQTIRLWDIDSGRCLNLLHGHSGWVRSLAFSPDGKLLASGSEDQTIRLWDIDSGRCLKALHGHSKRVRWVTFSPGGNILASSSDDGTIKFWDSQSYKCFQTLIWEKPYERMSIAYAQGLTEAQKANLRALGAIE